MEPKVQSKQCWIDRELGRGSYGNVYLLTYRQSPKAVDSKYALKVVEERGMGAKDREASHKELLIMRSLYHPSIVTLIDSFQVHHRLLLILELCEGGDLRQFLDNFKARRRRERGEIAGVEESLVLQWSLQLTAGLQYLHHKKILHRDLKPQNIFLKDRYHIKIGDLGIARQLVFTKEMADTQIGTPLYISPEIYQGNPYSYKTDVWSLGCCVYEMMALSYAFHAPSRYELVGKVVSREVVPLPESYSRALRTLVLSMLVKHPDDRPHATQLLDSLQGLHENKSLPPWQIGKGTGSGPETFGKPRESKAVQDWRLNMATALSQFLGIKQAAHCAQLNAALADLSLGSIKDIACSSGKHASRETRAKGRTVSTVSSSSTGDNVSDGDETISVSSSDSDNSDTEATIMASQLRSQVKSDRSMNGSGISSAQLGQNRKGKNINVCDFGDGNWIKDEADSDSDSSVTSSNSHHRSQPNMLKLGKFSTALSYVNTATAEKDKSVPLQTSGTNQHQPSLSKNPGNKGIDMDYANEVLQWARARLLPSDSCDKDRYDCNGLAHDNHDKSVLTIRNDDCKHSSYNRLDFNQLPSSEEKECGHQANRPPHSRNMMNEKEGGGLKQTTEAKDLNVVANREGRGKDFGAEKDKGAVLPTDQANKEKMSKEKKKKRNFLRERRLKTVEDQTIDKGKLDDKLSSGSAKDAVKFTQDKQQESGVKLFTRAQFVKFSCSESDEIDLCLGSESAGEGEILWDVGQARLQAAISTASLLSHNPSLLELQLKDLLGRENFKKYAATIVKMAQK